MTERGLFLLRRTLLLGGVSGFGLAFVVSFGILIQRIAGLTVVSAAFANAVTTLIAVVVVLVTVRTFLTSFESEELAAPLRERRIRHLLLSQSAGAVAAVVVMHLVVYWAAMQSNPWLREHPRQLVNDMVGVFAILLFVWGCAQKPLRLEPMVVGLGLVLVYECTARLWHLDARGPEAHVMPWSIQQFVGGEVTATGIGVLAFRMLRA